MGEIRYGKVSSVDQIRMTARVVFEDKDNMVSWDLPVVVPNALKNRDYQLPDIGEKVVCAFLDNSLSQGFILGAVYDQTNLPSENDANIRSVRFDDGTVIEYNRATHNFTMDCKGSVDIIAANNVHITGDAIINGISFLNHVHGGVQSGGSDTSNPK